MTTLVDSRQADREILQLKLQANLQRQKLSEIDADIESFEARLRSRLDEAQAELAQITSSFKVGSSYHFGIQECIGSCSCTICIEKAPLSLDLA